VPVAAQQFAAVAHVPETNLAVLRAGREPPSVRRERERRDGALAGLPGAQGFVRGQVPQSHAAIRARRGGHAPVGRDDDGKYRRRVAREVVQLVAGAQVPQPHTPVRGGAEQPGAVGVNARL